MSMKEEDAFLTGRRDREMLVLVDRLDLKSKKDSS